MVIGYKDMKRMLGVLIVAACASFVCYLFLSYRLDLLAIDGTLTDPEQIAYYQAQLLMSEIICLVTGGLLAASAMILLLFCIKSTVDAHKKELKILKALGYSDGELSLGFWLFGLGVGLGCALGGAAALVYLPNVFYRTFDALPLQPRFHAGLLCLLVLLPTLVYAALAVLMAYSTLKRPRAERARRAPKGRRREKRSFLRELERATVSNKKVLAFFIAFSCFCFSAMTQMSFSMEELASKDMAIMMLVIGLALAFMSLFLSLSELVKGNAESLALLKAFGYTGRERCFSVFGGYLPFSALGFAVGTLYQWGLLKIMITFVFRGMEEVPAYAFDVKGFFLSLAAFVAVYGVVLWWYLLKAQRASLKVVMAEI